MVGLGVALCLASSCGGSSTAPSVTSGSVAIATGPQVLRLTYTSFICSVNSAPPNPLLYTRVTVSQVGDEWVAVAATPQSGDLEMRFHRSNASLVAGSMAVEGTIRGQAIHLPELISSLPVWNSRLAFGTDGRTTVTGVAFGPSAQTPTGGVDGTGAGTVTLSGNTGVGCGGLTFSWTLAPER
jgi:hypothetical protein